MISLGTALFCNAMVYFEKRRTIAVTFAGLTPVCVELNEVIRSLVKGGFIMASPLDPKAGVRVPVDDFLILVESSSLSPDVTFFHSAWISTACRRLLTSHVAQWLHTVSLRMRLI
jgi:hypothetical protein